MLRSYAVEAQRIGVEDFAPLRRQAAEIRDARSTFYGCSSEGGLAAVAEVERQVEGPANIASFAVRPGVFRRGVGSALLRHVIGTLGSSPVTVSTASGNEPAIALYEQQGFRASRCWTTPDRIEMVTLVLDPQAPVPA